MFRSRMKYRLSVLIALVIGGFCLAIPAQAQDSLWASRYGGSLNESANAITRLSSGDFVLCGSTFSYGAGEHDVYVVKTDSVGLTRWQETYGGTGTEYGFDLQQTSDGGFIIVGSTTSSGAGGRDVYLVKTDSGGAEQWTRTIGGANNDEGRSIRELYDHGFIICGTTASFGVGTDIYVIRTDSLGDTLWTKTYGGAAGESGAAIRETSDSGFIMIGNTGSYGTGYSSMYAVRTDSIGDTLWTATYGNDRADLGATVEIAFDDGFIFGGTTVEDGENYYDAFVVKTDSLGVLEWDSAYGGAYEDRVYAIQPTPDGGYIVGGMSEGGGSRKMDVLLLKIDGGGTTEWSRTYGGSEADYCLAVILDNQNDYFAAGYSYSATGGGSDAFLLKVQRAGATAVDDDNSLIPDRLVILGQNYPNPFNLSTTIEFTMQRSGTYSLMIFNILGQIVRSWDETPAYPGTHSVEWDGRNDNGEVIASGVYFYRFQAGEFAETKKMVLLK